jgi:hypothetical protein
MYTERMKNKVAAMRYIQSNTDIPTLNIRCAFEDRGRYYIIGRAVPQDQVLKLREATTPEYLLCHKQHNVMVDETTLKINAIIDWEHAGFFPPEFDGVFYLRPGPSGAIEDVVPKLLELLEFWKA